MSRTPSALCAKCEVGRCLQVWVFTRYGFYSIACTGRQNGAIDPGTVMIRALRAAHLRSRRNPCIGSLDPAADPAALIHHLGPDRARALIGIYGQVQGHVLFQGRTSKFSPVVGSGPSNNSDRVMKEINNWRPPTASMQACRNECRRLNRIDTTLVSTIRTLFRHQGGRPGLDREARESWR